MTSLSQISKLNKLPLEEQLTEVQRMKILLEDKLRLVADCERMFEKHSIDCAPHGQLGEELDEAMKSNSIAYVNEIDMKVRSLIHNPWR